MIPPFDERSNLPPGIHPATWVEVVARFGTTARRRVLLSGLRTASVVLAAAGCLAVWIDGSFVTTKDDPEDFDGAWEIWGIDETLLEDAFQGADSPAKTKAAYGGSLFPVSAIAEPTWSVVLEFFQWDKGENRRGIVVFDPRKVER